jgi:ABC-type arginine transport system permease subunit
MISVQFETILDLIFCIIIFVLGYMEYEKTKKPLGLYVGVAFALFGISHLATLANVSLQYTGILTVLRTIAYILVILGLYFTFKKKK